MINSVYANSKLTSYPCSVGHIFRSINYKALPSVPLLRLQRPVAAYSVRN